MKIRLRNLLILLTMLLSIICFGFCSSAESSDEGGECQHSFSLIKSDRDIHWNECEKCSEKSHIEMHTFEDGVCTICGEEEVLYGDANGDGKIDSKDVILLKKYIANLDNGKSSVTLGPTAVTNEKGVTDKRIPVELYALNDGNSTVGEKDAVFYGDANGDGAISSKDIILLKKYIANLNDGKSSVILGHNAVVEPGHPATCTEDGMTVGIKCTACEKVLASKEVIPASGHVDADFDYVCEKCGLSILSTGLAYNINSDYISCTIRSIGTCTDRNVNIPEYIDGYKVTAIENTAFYACDVESVTIPKTVTRIGKWAFNFCKLKKAVILGNNTRIEYGAFMHCSDLEEIVLTEGVSLIENYVFEYCTSLKNVKVPGSVKSIGYGAFMDCTALEEVVFEDGIETIGEWAFQDCTSLVRVVLPESVTTIKKGAFNNCSSLTDITLPSAINSVADCTFQKCISLEYINIPTGVTSIGEWAFWSCNSLKKIVIPDSVESIGELAFYQCPSIETVFYGGSSDMWSKINIDSYNSDLTSATRYYYSENKPSENGEYWYYVDGIPTVWSIPTDFLYTINEDGITCTITGYKGTKKSITIPERIDGYTVTAIGDKAFYKCKNLKSITISDGVTSIGNDTFRFCTSLTSIIIPDSVTNIGEYAFCDCTGLTSIAIPDSVTSIGDCAFLCCTSLTSITIPKQVTSIDCVFYGCTSLTSVTISDSMTTIGDCAFYGCKKLTNITIPNSVTRIEAGAFQDCTSLTSVTISDSVTEIAQQTFYGCTSLTSITIPDGVTSIGNHAFYSCKRLTSITIPDRVTSIGGGAFQDCTSLTSITIPNSVMSIDIAAFYNCTGLMKVYYEGTAAQWSKKVLVSTATTICFLQLVITTAKPSRQGVAIIGIMLMVPLSFGQRLNYFIS